MVASQTVQMMEPIMDHQRTHQMVQQNNLEVTTQYFHNVDRYKRLNLFTIEIFSFRKIQIVCHYNPHDYLDDYFIFQLGPPSRLLVARCLTALFTVGDTFLLFDTINR